MVLSSSDFMSVPISVLELKLLASSNSEVSRLSSVVFGFTFGSVNTLPFSSLIKSFWSAHLDYCIPLYCKPCIAVSVTWSVLIVSRPVLPSSAGILSGPLWGLSGLVRSLMSFGLPRAKVLFLKVALSESSCVFGLSVSCGASGSLSVSIIAIRFGFVGDFVNWPSSPLGPFPLMFSTPLLFSCTNSVLGLRIIFLCFSFPLGVVTVCLVPDIAVWGLSKYALSNLNRSCFSLKIEKGSY